LYYDDDGDDCYNYYNYNTENCAITSKTLQGKQNLKEKQRVRGAS